MSKVLTIVFIVLLGFVLVSLSSVEVLARVMLVRHERSQPTPGSLALQMDSQNVDLVGQIGGTTQAVAVEGNYAHVGVGPRLVIVDLTTPTVPIAVGQSEVLPGIVQGVAVAGSYAFVADDTGGLQIINVADPAAPAEVGFYDTPERAYGVAVAGSYAYVAVGDSGLRVIGVSMPATPTEVGFYDTPGEAYGVAVAGSYAYVADGSSGLRVLDVSTPAAPVEIGFYDTPGIAHDVAVAERYVYVADGGSGLRVIDVTTPAAPTEVGFYDTPGDAWGVITAGDYVYIADRWEGWSVISVTNPAAPARVGFCNTPGYADDVAAAGGYAYVANGEYGGSGLQVINVANPAAPQCDVGFYDTPGEPWGVTAVGNYAYIADGGRGLRVIDVANSKALDEVGAYDTPGSAWGVAVAGSHAYIADGWSGLRVISVANPAAPFEEGSYGTLGEAYDVAVAENYAYVVADTGGLRVIDVTTPAAPAEVGFYDTPGYAVGVAVESYVYVADYDRGLRVIDVSTPAMPVEVGFYDTPGYAWSVAVIGGYAFVADGDRGLQVIDVSTPTAPVGVGSYETPGTAYYVAVSNDYAYIADGDSGLWVVNVMNPAMPVGAGFYDTSGTAAALAVMGDLAYVADAAGGLVILRFTGGATPTPTATSSLTPLPTNTPTPTTTPTKTSTSTHTPPPTSSSTPTTTATPTATASLTPTSSSGDAFEPDNTCAQAKVISSDGSSQSHTFHLAGDQDWMKFTAPAKRTYIFEVANAGSRADPVVLLYDSCSMTPPPPLGGNDNPFGPSLRLEWDGEAGVTYWLKLIQHDPSVAGPETDYDVTLSQDVAQPGPPKNPRCASLNSTTLSMQWDQSPEWDVEAYQVSIQAQDGSRFFVLDVDGAANTYVTKGELAPNKWYNLWVRALDYSNNVGDASATVFCKAIPADDWTVPVVAVQQPVTSGTYSTTLSAVSFAGTATDPGSNLSRVRVYNATTGSEPDWDYSLSGSAHSFHVENVGLVAGNNTIEVTAFDSANNESTKATITVKRETAVLGAVIIVAGRNEKGSLQSNIEYSANRAYRVFRGAGFTKDQIRYLASSSQDLDGDGVSEVAAPSTTANIQYAVQTWAKTRVDADNPLYLYMIDHGLIEEFCVDGCGGDGAMDSTALDEMLTALEDTTGVDEVNVIIEACHSGSFIDWASPSHNEYDSLSKAGRVIITSTDREHNAYASAWGARFSDVFFTCIASSENLKSCFVQARAAATVNPNGQSPWMDDNGDSQYNGSDGSVAQMRYIAKFFGASVPEIISASVIINGTSGTLTAEVQQGSAKIEMVWVEVYAPSFQPPTGTTLDLGVPMKKLDADPNVMGRYTAEYPNGFGETGEYRVVFYARDKADNYATPLLVIPGVLKEKVWLPLILR